MKTNYLYIIPLLVLTSCMNEKKQDNTDVISTTQDAVITNFYNVIDDTPNVYENYIKSADHAIGYTALKSSPLNSYKILEVKPQSESAAQYAIHTEGEAIQSYGITNGTSKENIYGNRVTFKVRKPGTVGYGIGEVETFNESEVSMYIPELVSISNPKVSTAEEQFPSCYVEDLVIEWNADPDNENGLMVFAEYFGDNAIPQNEESIHIMNIDYIEGDDGKAVLNPELFEGVPNLGIVHLILLRGNVTIEDIEGELYKFFAESHVRLPIVLVRDLNTIALE
ncbi:MAG: hypothetical protein ACPF80_03290 [Flavobacteriaceae bacterium]